MKVHLVASSGNQNIVENFRLYTAMLRRQGVLEIASQEDATIVIAFVSPHLMSDDFCQQALYVAKYKNKLIIPITVAPCEWKDDSVLGKLQNIPKHNYLCNDLHGDLWMETVRELRSTLERLEYKTTEREHDY